ncbi:surface lipoprotein assembly modifier [Allopusillimonas ginsengisoli]|uniref:surface lipoprotein assembly modifier n=1 Tax=Allopusillimonas ginsengisoli TaxID=453575 RepID=UPI00101F6AD5|nr:surface lipoprotein assembly modifier [Allopusillimonas ginsengisoli]TEA78440.1 DUF560 domain-containing protein [Allopusillimonas ginsengisoli]
MSKAYSRKTGVKAQWNYWWSPRWQSLAAWEYGRQKHRTRTHLDHRGHLASLSFLFYPTDSQYWLFGHDIQVQTGTRDASDSFQQVGLRAAWGQTWTSGLGSRINAQINTDTHF